MIKPHRLRAAASFLLISLAACGSSFTAGSENEGVGDTGTGAGTNNSAVGPSRSDTDPSIDIIRSPNSDRLLDGAPSTDSDRFSADSASAESASLVHSSSDGSASDGSASTDSGSFVDHANVDGGGNDADARNSISIVNLGTAGNYALIAESAISTVPTSSIGGDVAISPAAVTLITGFSLAPDSTNQFSTSLQVNGKVYAANHAVPTPSKLITAVGDMQRAFGDAGGRASTFSEVGTGDIGGMTLAPGVYKWSSVVVISKDVVLAASATDVWIFQLAQTFTMTSNTSILLTGGAMPKNIFWRISGAVDLGTGTHLEGVLMTQTSIALHTGASIKGRLFAQTAITMDGNAVVEPEL